MVTAQSKLVRNTPDTGMLNWKVIAFYVGIPLCIGLYGAINNWEIQQSIGYSGTLIFYLSHSLVPWWITSLCTFGLMQLLQRWKPRPIALMIGGAFAGCLVTTPYTNWITHGFESTWPMQAFAGVLTHTFSAEFFIFYLRVVAIWIAVNLIFDRYIGLPRYRYEHENSLAAIQPATRIISSSNSAADPSLIRSVQPAFLARLPEAITIDQVLAVSAEQHYIRVFTAAKEHMILYRFSDAIREMDADLGMQVHRSWWIARSAIATMTQGTKKFHVQLSNGESVPVSTPYQGMLKELARKVSIPIRPAAAKTTHHS
jgi:hypothetical protein